ncbi:MAG: hypothetical protein ACOX52_21940 [Verrucomicrobiota bacterium]
MKKLLLPVMALLVMASVSNAAINLGWRSDLGVYTEAGTGDFANLLPPGSIVQLIHAGADGVANDLDIANPDLVGGDDTILDMTVTTGWDGGGGVIYGGLFTKGPIVYDTVGATDSLFIRAFNGTDLAAFATAGGYYGNSALKSGWNTDLGAIPPPIPDALAWDEGVTDIYFAGGGGSVIPEPSTVMLALAGALMVLRKLRK